MAFLLSQLQLTRSTWVHPHFQWGSCYPIVCFVDRWLLFCHFPFGHSVVCSSSIHGFWLPLWYLQTLLRTNLLSTSSHRKVICYSPWHNLNIYLAFKTNVLYIILIVWCLLWLWFSILIFCIHANWLRIVQVIATTNG